MDSKSLQLRELAIENALLQRRNARLQETNVGLNRRIEELEGMLRLSNEVGDSRVRVARQARDIWIQERDDRIAELELENEKLTSRLGLNSAQMWTSTGGGMGDLIIEEQDFEGKFIRIYNKGDEPFSVGNWVVRSTAGGLETKVKFKPGSEIAPGVHLTIWSSNANIEYEPSENFVFKYKIWPHDRCIRTELLNSAGEVFAWRECVFNQNLNAVKEELKEEEKQ
uniref:LTD domain-containing protein n=1 Tax=Meloidogyne floridensis TaxID=298350 RepID=A0A915NTE4_9BILA